MQRKIRALLLRQCDVSTILLRPVLESDPFQTGKGVSQTSGQRGWREESRWRWRGRGRGRGECLPAWKSFTRSMGLSDKPATAVNTLKNGKLEGKTNSRNLSGCGIYLWNSEENEA